MSIFLIICLICLIILIYNFRPDESLSKSDLDFELLKGWWSAPKDFCDQSEINYMFLQCEPKWNGNKIIIYGYVIAGDNEGLLYNTPIKIELISETLKFSLSSAADDKFKGKYLIKIDDSDDCESSDVNQSEKNKNEVFPDGSKLIIDRAESSISIYKDDILYGYFT